MRYTQPKIISTLAATAAIQGYKDANQLEINLFVPTNGPAYQAEE